MEVLFFVRNPLIVENIPNKWSFGIKAGCRLAKEFNIRPMVFRPMFFLSMSVRLYGTPPGF